MGDYYKINEHDFDDYDGEYPNKVSVVKAGDEVDGWWGLDKIIVTIEDIEELKQGKFWYFNDGEYATVIGLKRGRRMTELEKEFSPKGFANKMRRLSEMGDPEIAHFEGDKLMCELLTKLGYDEGVKIFDDMSKWYA